VRREGEKSVKWSQLPKCLVTDRMCEDYYRGRCKRIGYCSYKEEADVR